jgi:hypothetical protein
MPSITSLATKLQTDFPRFGFVASHEFRWSPKERTIFYDQDSSDQASLLHELSHAILDHREYARDIELIELERDAWTYARETLAHTYDASIDSEQSEDALDTYRDWLHARSICPGCLATGLQTKKNEYKCILCTTKWRVNDARICALRRYKITK